MKVKRVKIGIRSVKDVLDDFVATGEAIEKGIEVKREKAIYFESIGDLERHLRQRGSSCSTQLGKNSLGAYRSLQDYRKGILRVLQLILLSWKTWG